MASILASHCRSRLYIGKFLLSRAPILTPIQNRKAAIKSEQFPEYSLIYDFNRIRTISTINRLKMRTTVLFLTSTPVMYLSYQIFDVLTLPIVSGYAYFAAFVTVFFHSIGFLFNDVIGYIYVKDTDENIVKISRVNYWGQRIDTDTTANKIQALTDTSRKLDVPWYQNVHFTDSKEKYKIYLLAGRILDARLFNNIFGNVYAQQSQ